MSLSKRTSRINLSVLILIAFSFFSFNLKASTTNSSFDIAETYTAYFKYNKYYFRPRPRFTIFGSFHLPFYKDPIFTLQRVGQDWIVEYISITEFNNVNPPRTNNIEPIYQDIDNDRDTDIVLNFPDSDTVHIFNNGFAANFSAQSTAALEPRIWKGDAISESRNRVKYIHTDLLNSPVTETR